MYRPFVSVVAVVDFSVGAARSSLVVERDALRLIAPDKPAALRLFSGGALVTTDSVIDPSPRDCACEPGCSSDSA